VRATAKLLFADAAMSSKIKLKSFIHLNVWLGLILGVLLANRVIIPFIDPGFR